jgi:hypothetical protein
MGFLAESLLKLDAAYRKKKSYFFWNYLIHENGWQDYAPITCPPVRHAFARAFFCTAKAKPGTLI